MAQIHRYQLVACRRKSPVDGHRYGLGETIDGPFRRHHSDKELFVVKMFHPFPIRGNEDEIHSDNIIPLSFQGLEDLRDMEKYKEMSKRDYWDIVLALATELLELRRLICNKKTLRRLRIPGKY